VPHPVSEDTREYPAVTRASSLAIATTRLLNALLDISRLESGAIEPQRTHVAVPDLLNELRAEFDSIARDRGLELSVKPVAATVLTDRELFYQLLQNSWPMHWSTPIAGR
jgi:signal transduction histidine kinase